MKELTDMQLYILAISIAVALAYPLSILVWRYEFKKAYKETGNHLFLERMPKWWY